MQNKAPAPIFKQAVKLLVRALCLVLPFALAWTLTVLRSGETYDVDEVVLRQQQNPSVIYGPAYSNNVYYFKYQMTVDRDPELLVLGDSRAVVIRKFFFHADTDFYSASLAAPNTADMLLFLESLPENNHIKTLFFPISHFQFNQNYANMFEVAPSGYFRAEPPPTLSQVSDGLLADWKRGKFSATDVIFSSGDSIGLSASVGGTGWISDGSYFYGTRNYPRAQNPDSSSRIANTLARIESGTDRFEPGSEVFGYAVQNLDALLQYCSDKGIHVIAYLPPYAPSVNDALLAKKNLYNYHFNLPLYLEPVFSRYGFEFYDYTDITSLGCDDGYFVDGFHNADTAQLLMQLDMIRQGSKLADYCDPDALLQLYDNRYDDFRLFRTAEEYLSCLEQHRKQS